MQTARSQPKLVVLFLTLKHDLHLQARPGEWVLSQSALQALLRAGADTTCDPTVPGPSFDQLPYAEQDVPSQATPVRQDMMESATDQLSQQLAPGCFPVEYDSGFGLHASAQSFGSASHQHSYMISNGQPAVSAFGHPGSCVPQPTGSDPASELRQYVADPPGDNFGPNATGQNPGSSTQTSGAAGGFMQQLLASPTGSGAVVATPLNFPQHFPSQACVLDAAQGASQGPIGSETSAQAVSL